jgi:GNAT superfamily N-acetyltransferase
MTKTIQIETANRNDWSEILSITRAAYNEYAQKSDKTFWESYQLSIERTILTDDSVIRIVARDDKHILGTIIYCPPYEQQLGDVFVKNPFPEMRLLAVPPEGRNQGIAGRLIEYCEDKAGKEGSPTITLHTTVLMETAKQMYERRGYLRFAEIDFEPIPGFIVWGYKKDLLRQ